MSADLVALAYLLASVFFILALKGLSSPLSARRGNLFGMLGMAIAVVTTLTITENWMLILGCIVVGGSIGAIVAKRVQMTETPEFSDLRQFPDHRTGRNALQEDSAIAFCEKTGIQYGQDT